MVNTSSSGAYMEKIDWETFTDTLARRKKATGVLYNQSKFVNSICPASHSRILNFGAGERCFRGRIWKEVRC